MSEIIRVEEPRDFAAVENVVREAFWNVYRPGCTEHYVLHRFRSENAFIPDFKRRGYGVRLLRSSLEKARSLGVGFLCMEGNLAFYQHAGFRPAREFALRYHSCDDAPFFLAQELIALWCKENRIDGATYTPPEPYCAAEKNPTDFARYEATFPHKEKLVLEGQLC